MGFTTSSRNPNREILAQTSAIYTDSKDTKLANLDDRFKGVFADSAARDLAIATPKNGDYCKQNDTNTIWFYATSWINTGSNSTGDMLAAAYDPNSVGANVYDRANHTGEQAISSVTNLEARLAALEAANGSGGIVATVGMYMLWDKPASQIPTGWQVADGTNGTVDLRGEFVRGAGNDTQLGNAVAESVKLPNNLSVSSYEHLHQALAGNIDVTITAADISHTHTISAQAATTGNEFATGKVPQWAGNYNYGTYRVQTSATGNVYLIGRADSQTLNSTPLEHSHSFTVPEATTASGGSTSHTHTVSATQTDPIIASDIHTHTITGGGSETVPKHKLLYWIAYVGV